MKIVVENQVVPSVGSVAGACHIGPLPMGEYKTINPIGGRASRLRNDRVLVVPFTQNIENYYEGSYFEIDRHYLKTL